MTAERALFAGEFSGSDTLVGVAVAAGLAAFATWFAARAIRSGS